MERTQRLKLGYMLFPAVLIGTFISVASCSRNDPAYQQFTSRRDQIRQGMDRADVEAILGKPVNTFSGDTLPDSCKKLHGETATSYEFEHANRAQKLLANLFTRTPPSVTRVTVCIDSNGKVSGIDTSRITH